MVTGAHEDLMREGETEDDFAFLTDIHTKIMEYTHGVDSQHYNKMQLVS